MEADAEHLWELEGAYIRAHLEADHEAVLALWDEDFLGWPSRLPNTSGKDGGAAYLAEYFPEPTQLSPRLERQGIRFAGDAAILHYRLHWGGTDAGGSITTATTRLTHTWIKRDSGWRILGGMDWSEPAADQQATEG
jgi:ketosteroid isomerase-like protein